VPRGIVPEGWGREGEGRAPEGNNGVELFDYGEGMAEGMGRKWRAGEAGGVKGKARETLDGGGG